MIRRTLMALFLTLAVGGLVAACNSTPGASATPGAPTVAPTVGPSSAPTEAPSASAAY
jgi:hypothetical protein